MQRTDSARPRSILLLDRVIRVHAAANTRQVYLVWTYLSSRLQVASQILGWNKSTTSP